MDTRRYSAGVSQYFETSPRSPNRPGTVDLVLPDLHLRLATDSGVFSADRIDPGTRILLETVPAPPARGDLLDLGCGYGPVALTMAVRARGAAVWAVDVNRRALALTGHNARTAGLGNVRACGPEDIDPAVRFAAIWSNPPVRIGKPAMQQLLTTWLHRLLPGAEAHLVVHKHLGSDSLQRWLVEQGWSTQRVASRAGYRILRILAR
ncbi:MAG: methyltransferase [Streptosporangiales bacterium]|nr:methyltransferase [Streptosporangiales bacterium]